MIPRYRLEKSFNNQSFNEFCIDKLKTYEFFQDIPQPETLIYNKKNLKLFFKNHEIALMKPRYLKKGEGIFLLKKTDKYQFLKNYLIQEYIENGFEDYHYDIRIYVQRFEKLIIAPYARISKKLVSNLAQGGKVDDAKILLDILFPDQDILAKILSYVDKITQRLKFEEAGIDFIINKEGKVFLIEINSFPEILGLFILKNPDDSDYERFKIKYNERYKKEHEKLLQKIRKNRYEALKCAE